MGDNDLREVDLGDVHAMRLTHLTLTREILSKEIRTRLREEREEIIRGFAVIEGKMIIAENEAREIDRAAGNTRGNRSFRRRQRGEDVLIGEMKRRVAPVVNTFFRGDSGQIAVLPLTATRMTEAIMFEDVLWRVYRDHLNTHLAEDEAPRFRDLQRFVTRAADEQEALQRQAAERRRERDPNAPEAFDARERDLMRKRVNRAVNRLCADLGIRRASQRIRQQEAQRNQKDEPIVARRLEVRLPPILQARRNQ